MFGLDIPIYFPTAFYLGLLSYSGLARATENYSTGLGHYRTRPDIKAPLFNVEVYSKDALSPGYWFLAPYQTLIQPPGAPDDGWVGPAIYSGDGELVWSGAPMFGSRNVEEFQMSDVKGEQLITLMQQQEHAGFIVNNNYTIHTRAEQVESSGNTNTHEFNFVNGGTETIVVTSHRQDPTPEMVEALQWDGECRDIVFDGFAVLDTKSWQPKFEWDSFGRIGLDESTLGNASTTEKKCSGGWDYMCDQTATCSAALPC